jgi:5-methylcytosine-specific restriction endonuclease McrA
MSKCKYCGGLGHNAFNCPKKPRKTLVAKYVLKPKKRLQKSGKLAQKYAELRKQFFIDHPYGPYECLYCIIVGLPTNLEANEVNVEHFKSKTKHVELRFVKGNLVVSCPGHNADKGGMNGDQYIRKLRKEMQDDLQARGYPQTQS